MNKYLILILIQETIQKCQLPQNNSLLKYQYISYYDALVEHTLMCLLLENTYVSQDLVQSIHNCSQD